MNKPHEDQDYLSLASLKLNENFAALTPTACVWVETIINTITDSVIILDQNYQILMVNQKTLTWFGYSEDELINQSIFDILDESFDQNSGIEQSLQQPVQTKYLKQNGQKISVFLSSHLIIQGNEQAMAIICIAKDMNQEKRIEKLIKDSEARLHYDIRHDKLTGLPNRKLFLEELDKSLQKSRKQSNFRFSVLILDLDQFKLINNSYGHVMGDKLLKQIGERLKQYLHPEDILTRLGGDEFGIILNNLDDVDHTLEVVNFIKKDFARSFHLDGYEVFSSASIGIALSDENYQNVADILRDADAALTQAKIKDKASYTIFRREMHADALQRLQLDNDLRRAINRKEFSLRYQPIVTLKTQQVIGFEALIRWIHPEQGLIYPSQFIPIAEETGLIIPMSHWILKEACQQMLQWQKIAKNSTQLTMSVNLSGKQIIQANFVEQVMDIVQQVGLQTQYLKLEITENSLIRKTEEICFMLTQLKEQGIKLSMDDFGTGYSSLSYLHNFPFDTLKIDRSFIRNITKNTNKLGLTQTIINLAKNFGMEVVAEGIETLEQSQKLQELGCLCGQGYYFSHPLTANQVEKLISSNNSSLLF